METINHFGDTELISFKIQGLEFKYKQLIAEDELNMDFSYCYANNQFNGKKYKILRLAHNLKEVPYSKAQIAQIIQLESNWDDLSIDNRIKLLTKLKSIILATILEKTDKIDQFNEEIKKKLPAK